jgi:hypothetical protein
MYLEGHNSQNLQRLFYDHRLRSTRCLPAIHLNYPKVNEMALLL